MNFRLALSGTSAVIPCTTRSVAENRAERHGRLGGPHILYLEYKVLNVRVGVLNDVFQLSYASDFERNRKTCKPYSKFPITLFMYTWKIKFSVL